MHISAERFEQLVAEALDSLPELIKQKLENVAVVVEDEPSRVVQDRCPDETLFGLYEGTPRTDRSVWDQPLQPDIIHIYKRNIESICRTEEDIRQQVRVTVIHEIGHYFGLDEDDLQVLEDDEV